jgi:hypothetical protein
MQLFIKKISPLITLLKIIEKDNLKPVIILILAIIASALLEIVSIGSVLPMVEIFFNPSSKYSQYLFNIFNTSVIDGRIVIIFAFSSLIILS